ncbi:DNA mismatch endonuclease Vsr [Mesorhizobium sp. M2A.F.Ca.ET.039.01.1.1]|uniref:very short patch repair endonuclease n=1 Tax=Mesorhizobium sp. M2A.F.Ca.ET.039.01.1.1 TaxID=2496746 RepID=UPI000FCB1501|nr:DNA mismatch endonuclease Vsr [Mesorhizobium sp. M2A.F.Ca.ET.039.01.1.1]RWX59704.1 DNA mismatch endonuclease Vsr [Mesorhizobium sp. M2A.F.Ca.ET.039.01.1.1]
MVDTLTPAQRSERMSRIRSGNTKPEVLLRLALHRLGFRFRLHGRHLPGRPDIVLPKYKMAVFVHGCFWHRHAGCKVATTPKSNTEFWLEKFDRNVARDSRVIEELEGAGWRVIVAWECELDSPAKAAAYACEIAGRVRRIGAA